VGAAVELLTEIAEGYKEAAGALARKLAEVEEESRALEALAGQIEGWQERLAAYREGQADDAAVVAAVDERLAGIDREVRRLRVAWRRTPPSAREARRALEGVLSMAGADLRLRDREIQT
jgi:hypothetical protein